jgi:hypothetical protein
MAKLKTSGLGAVFNKLPTKAKPRQSLNQTDISSIPKMNTDFGMSQDINAPTGMKKGGFIARGHGKVMDHKIKITKEI